MDGDGDFMIIPDDATIEPEPRPQVLVVEILGKLLDAAEALAAERERMGRLLDSLEKRLPGVMDSEE